MRFALIIVLSLVSAALGHSQPRSVTLKVIDTIKKYIDLDEDPCEDFFSYACGNWPKFHPTGRYSESTGLVDHKINKRLLDLFKWTQINGDRDKIMRKVMTYFQSCRHDRKQRNKRYLLIAKPDKGLNWPLLEKIAGKRWPKKEFNWLLTVANLRRFGLNNALMEQIVTQNLTNSAQYVLDLDKPNLSVNKLPAEMEMFGVLLKIGLPKSVAKVMVNEINEFESKIANLLEIEDDFGILIPSVHDIEDDLPTWPWRKYFEILIGKPVSGDYAFQIRNFRYFMELSTLLEKTDAEVVCNYLMFKFLNYLIIDRSSSADKIDCMVDVRSKMDLAMNFIYAERFLKENEAIYTKDVLELVKNIRNEFRKKLLENRLHLSIEQIDFLKNKLDAMDLNMGNMPKNVDQVFVELYYQEVELHSQDYYKNHLELLTLRFKKEHEVLLQGKSKTADFFFVADSDTARSSTPFYLVRQNLIVVPYGFLQTPIYHHNMLDVLKYSLFGFNIAHEIAHGFDASGVIFDFQGTVQEIGSNITDNDKFSNALNCMTRDETTNLDERIADLVGLRLVYDTYFGYNFSFDEDVSLKIKSQGLDFKTLFFLNFAQFFCGNMAAEFMDHDSDNVRLQQTLLNFQPFAETFQCDLGSTMNPEEKCRLW